MQKKILAEKLREQSEKLQRILSSLHSPETLSAKETEDALRETEQLIRILSAYKFLADNKEVSADLHVHLKIMENMTKQEEVRTLTETAETKKEEEKPKPIVHEVSKPEPVAEKKPEPQNTVTPQAEIKERADESKVISRKKIEFGINDKYRMINELFHQSNTEFAAALDQLNLTETQEDAETYLDNLKSLYSWKAEHPLVKMLYSLTQKRFQ